MSLFVAQFSRSRADETFQVFSDISELPLVLTNSGNGDHIVLQPGDYSSLSIFVNPDVFLTALPGAILPTSIGGTDENVADLNDLSSLLDHVQRTDNPHNVTPQQVGVDNPIWNADRISDIGVDVSTIDNGDVLQYDGSIFSSVALTTDSVNEGLNLYFTEQRARDSISGTGLVQYDSSTGEINVDASAASQWVDEDPPGTGIYFPNFIGVNGIEAPDRPITIGAGNSTDASIRLYDGSESDRFDISYDGSDATFNISGNSGDKTYIFDGDLAGSGDFKAKFFPSYAGSGLVTGSVALEVFGPDSPNAFNPVTRLSADDNDTFLHGRSLSENKSFYKVRVGHRDFQINAPENLIVWGSIFATDNVRLRDTLTIGDDEDSDSFEYIVSVSDKALEIDILDEISTQDSGDSDVDRTVDLFKSTEFDVVGAENVGRMGLRIFDNTNSDVPQVNFNMVQDESGFATNDPYGSWIFKSFDDPNRFITLGIGTDSPTGNTNVEIDGTFGVLGNFSQISDTWFFDHDLTDNLRPVFNAQFADYSQIAPAGFGNGLAIDGEAQILELGADFLIELRPRGTGFGTGPADGGGFVGLYGKQEIYTDADGTNFHLSLASPIDAGEPSSFLSHSLQPSGNDLVYLIDRFIQSGADDILHAEYDMSVLPASDDTYDLGSPSQQWQSIYVGPGSYHLDGEQVLFVNAQGESTLNIDRLISNVVEPGDLDITTDGVDEGTNNLYFTEVRVHSSLSASGDLSYDGSGQFSVTTYKSSDFDSDLSGKSTTDLSEGSNLYFTDARVLSAIESASEVIVGGNFTVQGTTTVINSTEVNIGDNIIRLNANHTGTPTMDAGIEIERGSSTNAQLLWNESIDAWVAGTESSTDSIALAGDLSDFVSNGDNISTLTNDVGYITSAALPTNLSDLNNDVGYITNISGFDTDDLSEGVSNLYFTNSRVSNVLSGINITVEAGNQLTGGGTVSLDSGGAITINHANTSSQGNVSTSGGTVISAIDLDVRGHVTNINTRSLDGRYAQTSNLNISDWDTAYDERITGFTGSGNETVTLVKPDVANLTLDLSHIHGYADLPMSADDISNGNTGFDRSPTGLSVSGANGNGTLTVTIDREDSPSLQSSTNLSHSHGFGDLPISSSDVSNWDTAYDRSPTQLTVGASGRNVSVTISRENASTLSANSTFGQFGTGDVDFANQSLNTGSTVRFNRVGVGRNVGSGLDLDVDDDARIRGNLNVDGEIQANTIILPSA